jgi:hypothetical protein
MAQVRHILLVERRPNAVAIVPLFPPRSKRAEIFPERPPLDSAFDSQIEIRQ